MQDNMGQKLRLQQLFNFCVGVKMLAGQVKIWTTDEDECVSS